MDLSQDATLPIAYESVDGYWQSVERVDVPAGYAVASGGAEVELGTGEMASVVFGVTELATGTTESGLPAAS